MKYILFLALFLLACNSEQKAPLHHLSGHRMTIAYHLQIASPPAGFHQKAVDEALESTFQEIDLRFNCFNPLSELSILNRWPAHTPCPASKNLLHFLAFTGFMIHLSEGRFDPSVRPLIALWKNAADKSVHPTPQEIASTHHSVGWCHFSLHDSYIVKDISTAEVDLSGICKGHFLDLLKDKLLSLGYRDFLLEWGGEFVAAGEHPEKRPWRIAIKNPDSSRPSTTTLPLSNAGFATSGDYEQSWELEGKRYFHILNPATGFPYESKKGSIASASVMAPTCAIADAIATTLLTFPSAQEAEAWLLQLALLFPSLQTWIILN